MTLRLLISILILFFSIDCAEQEETQAVFIEIRVKTSDGQNHTYNKILPLGNLDTKNLVIFTTECQVSLDNNKYRLAFWPHIYPQITVPAIDIRFDLGNGIQGNSMAMPVEMFSVRSDFPESVMTAQIMNTKFLNSQREEYKNIYKDNLYCQRLYQRPICRSF